MIKKISIFLSIFLWILWIERVYAQIVVFPFEDLSIDINGINVTVAEKVAEAIESLGIEVTHPNQVIDFLAENHIRWVGWIDRVTAYKVSKRFGTNLVLLGTITEFQKKPPSLGLSVRLIRVKDYRVIWSRTVALSGKEEIKILDIKPLRIKEAMNKAVRVLVSNIPDEIIKHDVLSRPEIEVSDIFVNPRRVKGNEEIECAVHIEFSGMFPSELFFVSNGHKIPLVKRDHVYVARWKVPKKEGRYPIELVARWQNLSLEKKIFLTNFVVDNTPPKISLLTINGKKTPQGLAFKDGVFLMPSIENPEPIGHWIFEIISEDSSQVIVHEENLGNLPLKFVWQGIDNNGRLLPNGYYQISLKVWDLAGNFAQVKKKILLVKRPPQVDLCAKRWKGKIYLDFKINPHPLPISFWHLEIWSEDGNLISQFEGEGNPKTISIPDIKDLIYSLEIHDYLGNRFIVHSKEIEPMILQAAKKKREKEREQGWVEDF